MSHLESQLEKAEATLLELQKVKHKLEEEKRKKLNEFKKVEEQKSLKRLEEENKALKDELQKHQGDISSLKSVISSLKDDLKLSVDQFQDKVKNSLKVLEDADATLVSGALTVEKVSKLLGKEIKASSDQNPKENAPTISSPPAPDQSQNSPAPSVTPSLTQAPTPSSENAPQTPQNTPAPTPDSPQLSENNPIQTEEVAETEANQVIGQNLAQTLGEDTQNIQQGQSANPSSEGDFFSEHLAEYEKIKKELEVLSQSTTADVIGINTPTDTIKDDQKEETKNFHRFFWSKKDKKENKNQTTQVAQPAQTFTPALQATVPEVAPQNLPNEQKITEIEVSAPAPAPIEQNAQVATTQTESPAPTEQNPQSTAPQPSPQAPAPAPVQTQITDNAQPPISNQEQAPSKEKEKKFLFFFKKKPKKEKIENNEVPFEEDKKGSPTGKFLVRTAVFILVTVTGVVGYQIKNAEKTREIFISQIKSAYADQDNSSNDPLSGTGYTEKTPEEKYKEAFVDVPYENTIWDSFFDDAMGVRIKYPKNTSYRLKPITSDKVWFLRKNGYLIKIEKDSTGKTIQQLADAQSKEVNYKKENINYKGGQAIHLVLNEYMEVRGDYYFVNINGAVYKIWYKTFIEGEDVDDQKRVKDMLDSLQFEPPK